MSWLICEKRGVRIFEGKLCDKCGDRCYGGVELNLQRVTVHLCIECCVVVEDFILQGLPFMPPVTREEELQWKYTYAQNRDPALRQRWNAQRQNEVEQQFKKRFLERAQS